MTSAEAQYPQTTITLGLLVAQHKTFDVFGLWEILTDIYHFFCNIL